tara:strand:- start:427 stop:1011 length:585 start_codon:yes stop_codon:yes gene_type:complete
MEVQSDLKVTYKAFVLEQMNFGKVRGPKWKAWKDRTFPSRDMPSHEAAKCAALQGEEVFSAYHLQLHRAKHVDKKDITNQLVLRDIAIQSGLDVGRWEEDMKNGSGISQVADDHMEAEETWGVFGVPTLYFEKGKPLFLKLEEGDWEGVDDQGLLNAVIETTVERPYILEVKTPESSRRSEASQKKYKKYIGEK